LSNDLTAILSSWEHDPDEIQVRIVAGDDGRDKIQMRVDMGILQMEVSGRPDGTRPDGYESLLDAHEHRARAEAARGESYTLDSGACAALLREGTQYYQRYHAAFHIQCYDLVVLDTERNLRLFAFVVHHAQRQRDKAQIDQYRPYVLMMRTRARTQSALATDDYEAALAAIDEGIAGVRAFLSDYNELDNEAECRELGTLLRLRREVENQRPIGPTERLEQQISQAVEVEDYEEAARLRDQLRRLRGSAHQPKGRTS
jgi:UvrB/uvrC motif